MPVEISNGENYKKEISMVELKSIVQSHLFDKILYQDPAFKFSLQIDPAIHYLLKSVVQHSGYELDKLKTCTNRQLYQIAKEKKLLSNQELDKIATVLDVLDTIKQSTADGSNKNKHKEQLLNNADKYLQQVQRLAEQISRTPA